MTRTLMDPHLRHKSTMARLRRRDRIGIPLVVLGVLVFMAAEYWALWLIAGWVR